MHRKLTVLAVTAIAAAGTTTAVAATSSSSPKTPAARYEANLAGKLGVDAAKLDAAQRSAADQTIDQLVAAGKLEAGRATKLRAAVQRGRLPFASGTAARRRGGGVGLLAKAVGATREEVAAALKAGATPADVISGAGKDAAAVRDAIRTSVRERLQKRVDAGKLDVAQADARAAKVATRLTADASLRARRGTKAGG